MTDIEFITYAESVCFEKPWSRQEIGAAVESEYGIGVVHDGVGYALGTISYDEAELYRIAVLPEKRGIGEGSALLKEFIERCAERGASKIFLEVRSLNVHAIKLYEQVGFRRISVRQGYYGDDDAFIYLYEM